MNNDGLNDLGAVILMAVILLCGTAIGAAVVWWLQ